MSSSMASDSAQAYQASIASQGQVADQTAFFLSNYRLGKTLGVGSFGKVGRGRGDYADASKATCSMDGNSIGLRRETILIPHALLLTAGQGRGPCADRAPCGYQDSQQKKDSANGDGGERFVMCTCRYIFHELF